MSGESLRQHAELQRSLEVDDVRAVHEALQGDEDVCRSLRYSLPCRPWTVLSYCAMYPKARIVEEILSARESSCPEARQSALDEALRDAAGNSRPANVRLLSSEYITSVSPRKCMYGG